ncbi:ABC transporter permease [Luteimonas sp. BDR2-5]|uniref:ABC transporter permease n=1 Tax=Proluteimonas luteida TaxID=2878685 RepID=UPI001E55E42D|nr:ABC transporter permease [Luteimonas sp. BDR2-5]MCD9027495.1 ABC transporter permease [Luteimonas sp. BDR2-5]
MSAAGRPQGFRATFAWTWRALLGNRYAVVTMLLAVVLYSVFYPTAYRNEVASSLPVVVVDDDRSAESRALLRKLDSMRAIEVVGTPLTLADARRAIESGHAEGIVHIPGRLQRDLARGGQAQLVLLGNGAFLGRASSVLEGMGDAIRGWAVEVATAQAMYAGAPTSAPYTLVKRPLFNTQEGYGSSIVPGVSALIVHQTLLIGICVLGGGLRMARGRRLRARPVQLAAAACLFWLVGMTSLLYYTGFTFWAQDYPRGGNLPGLLAAGSVFIAAIVALGLLLASLFRSPERAFQLLLMTSVPLFFLSNLSWPWPSTPAWLHAASQLLPTTPGINAMVRLNQMGASLAEVWPQVATLAALALGYGALALWRWRGDE